MQNRTWTIRLQILHHINKKIFLRNNRMQIPITYWTKASIEMWKNYYWDQWLSRLGKRIRNYKRRTLLNPQQQNQHYKKWRKYPVKSQLQHPSNYSRSYLLNRLSGRTIHRFKVEEASLYRNQIKKMRCLMIYLPQQRLSKDLQIERHSKSK